MREITMHCSARDQDVRVVLTDKPVYLETELLVSSGGFVTCTECGTVRGWQAVH